MGPVSANSYTGVCEMVYSHPSIRFHKHRYTSSRHRYTSSQTLVYEFANTGIRVHRPRYTSSQTPVCEFTDTGIRVHRHRYTSSRTPKARVLGHRKRELKGQFN